MIVFDTHHQASVGWELSYFDVVALLLYFFVASLVVPFSTNPEQEKYPRFLSPLLVIYYARTINSTALVALGSIGTQQSKPSEKTQKAINHLLHYVFTYPDATVRFYASDMILHLLSDASYLSEPGARSRVGGYFFLSSKPTPNPPPFNGAIFVLSNIMKNVLASAAEAQLGALLFNVREAIPIRNTLV